jgi:L-aspartate oxidase
MKIVDTAEVVIVGAGAAGLFTALSLAPRKVVVLSEKPLGGICASDWAQGGIAAAVDKSDTPASHAADTLKAAAGTADVNVVRALTDEAPAVMKILAGMGVQFDRDENGILKLSREACHAQRRVLKAAAGDGFGHELMRALTDIARKTPSITFVGDVAAERIIRRDGAASGPVQGVLARRLKDNSPVIFSAPAVVLATGGVGGLYAATTNPLNAVGRGVAIAARAGAVLSDLEFVQFHPTALDIGEDPAPLASEALRGEGAYLLNSRGERFMIAYHPMAELAPRDVVSRGIFAQQQQGQRVYLDCRHINTSHFPALRAACQRANIDPQRDLVPVKPVAHYYMGGIETDLHGRTSIHGPWGGLWACGEVASTGLHGANRLASNSLMEAVVMGGRVAADIARSQVALTGRMPVITEIIPAAAQVFAAEKNKLRQIMMNKLGVIRHEAEMLEALDEILEIEENAKDSALADMALMARMITVCALQRTESRGAHCRSDYPESSAVWEKRSFVTLKEINSLTDDLRAPLTQRREAAV